MTRREIRAELERGSEVMEPQQREEDFAKRFKGSNLTLEDAEAVLNVYCSKKRCARASIFACHRRLWD
jgi:hypothetical protein